MYGTSPSLRSVMTANGDGEKKIWATEFGAPTDGPAGSFVSEGTQAKMISKAYSTWRGYDWAGPLFTYQGRDLGTSTDTSQNHFGLLHSNWSPKPAYDAYRQAVAAATGATPANPIPAVPGTPAQEGRIGLQALKGRIDLAGKPTVKGKKLKVDVTCDGDANYNCTKARLQAAGRSEGEKRARQGRRPRSRHGSPRRRRQNRRAQPEADESGRGSYSAGAMGSSGSGPRCSSRRATRPA